MRSRGAIVGVGEMKPVRHTEGETTLNLMAKAGPATIDDSGASFDDVDGLLVHPIGGVSMLARRLCSKASAWRTHSRRRSISAEPQERA